MIQRISRILMTAVVVSLVATACTSTSSPDEIVLLTHDAFALSEGTLERFTEETGVRIVVETAGDAGTMLNQAILTKDNPIADVMYGIDNTFLSRAIDNDLFIPYRAAEIDKVDEVLRVEGDPVTPIDFGDVCINYDIDGLDGLGIAPPRDLSDLTDPIYKDLLVVEDPATSSPGLAFLLATIAAYPDGAAYDWKAYWQDLFANGVAVTADWSVAYTARFTRSGGDRPLVVSYASSPPAEVFFGDLDAAPTGIMTEGCFRQIEYAGILAGTGREATAQQLVDFLLSRNTQEDIPLNMFVYPARRDVELPEVFAEFTILPESPVIMEPATIDANRERWIKEWTTIARS
ncbi:MAG: thiamine ABC transporter substrate-binding protein [Acidimicrobiia bacterium]|nr:MAG: thiamine ABC transporter substrate-binding protein [Acidimicrobiia bacterium]